MILEPNRDDVLYWSKLAKKRLSRYNLPKWDKPMTVKDMDRWASRLDIDEKDYFKATRTNYIDFIDMNPKWGMLAWVGLCLEFNT